MFYVYVLISKKDGKFYTGSTINLKRRLDDHRKGKVKSTNGRRPLDLIYYEACTIESDARRRERYLKSGTGKRYIKTRLNDFLKDL